MNFYEMTGHEYSALAEMERRRETEERYGSEEVEEEIGNEDDD